MPHTYQLSKELYHCVLRVPKDEAYFVYFSFEASEGLCFFSTLDESLKGQYRDLDVKCPIEGKADLQTLIGRLSTVMRLDVLLEEVIKDA
jgi:hypothetical protein